MHALDADLLAAEREVIRLRQQVHELMRAKDTLLLTGMLAALDRLDTTLVNTPAQSLVEVAAK